MLISDDKDKMIMIMLPRLGYIIIIVLALLYNNTLIQSPIISDLNIYHGCQISSTYTLFACRKFS